jgi:hypothetical protein
MCCSAGGRQDFQTLLLKPVEAMSCGTKRELSSTLPPSCTIDICCCFLCMILKRPFVVLYTSGIFTQEKHFLRCTVANKEWEDDDDDDDDELQSEIEAQCASTRIQQREQWGTSRMVTPRQRKGVRINNPQSHDDDDLISTTVPVRE